MISVFPFATQTPTASMQPSNNRLIRTKADPLRLSSLRPYYYKSTGEMCENPAFSSYSIASPKASLKYRPLGSKIEPIPSTPKSRPKHFLYSTQDTVSLENNLEYKEVFVVEDGSSLSGNKLKGFYYKICRMPMMRNEKERQLNDFFLLCRQELNRNKKFRVIFTVAGKMLQFLQDLSFLEKVLVVSSETGFVGVNQEEKGFEIGDRIPAKAPGTARIRLRNKVSKSLATQCLKKKLDVTQLKIKLGQAAVKIDTEFPKLFSQGMNNLRQKCKFSESEIYKLYAKYKMLVHLSIAKNPSHNIFFGISKEVFVESYQGTRELNFVLSRIFDCFDQDLNGCISWDEYLYAMDIMHNGNYESQLDLFFQVYDTDGNGRLSFSEIQELCKLQLQKSDADNIIDELSTSFAGLIFDMTETPHNQEIPAAKIKDVLGKKGDKSLIEMFCSFSFMKNK